MMIEYGMKGFQIEDSVFKAKSVLVLGWRTERAFDWFLSYLCLNMFLLRIPKFKHFSQISIFSILT